MWWLPWFSFILGLVYRNLALDMPLSLNKMVTLQSSTHCGVCFSLPQKIYPQEDEQISHTVYSMGVIQQKGE